MQLSDMRGLLFASTLPIVLSISFYFLDRFSKFKNIKPFIKQIIFGVSFGFASIIGSELGYQYLGAQINCRDAAPICAGLFFGPAAGIIAGLMGGVERWFAIYWGAGTYTRLACTIGTIFAGVHSAFLRGVLFENKRPFWVLSLVVAIISEVVHLMLVVVTNLNDVNTAYNIISNVSIYLIFFNSVSVGISALIMSIISKSRLLINHKKSRISEIFQKWILRAFAIAFIISTWFLFSYQTNLAKQQANDVIASSISDVKDSIEDISSTKLLSVAYEVVDDLDKGLEPDELATKYNVSDICVVNGDGIIYKANDERFINFDMNSGEQSKEFLVLLGDARQFAQEYRPISYNEGKDDEYKKFVGIKYKDGFVQVGYDAEQFQDLIDESIVDFARNRHIGQSGSILIVDSNNRIVYIPDHLKGDANEKVDLFSIEPLSLQETKIHDEDYFYSYDSTEGYLIVGVYPVVESMHTRNIATFLNVFVELIVFAGLYTMIFILINSVVVGRIKKFKKGLSAISNGDLDVSLNIRSSQEYSELSDDINKTVDTLKKYIKDAEDRIKAELELANNIQKSSLPIVTPIISKRSDFDIAPFMATAKEVGGDFYDFYFTNNHTLNFAIADVSGKGIPAALFMMRSKTELRSLSDNGYPVNEVLEKGNDALCEGNDAGMFVTCWQGRLDLETGILEFANGGHNPPVIKRANGETFFLKEKVNFILGGLSESKYVLQTTTLEKGDTIFLYTDGVTEATNSDKKLYGEDRLLNFISTHNFDSMNDLCHSVKDDIDLFVQDAPQFDDITMVALKYNGSSNIKQHDDILKLTNIQLDVECSDWRDAITKASNLLARSLSVHESYADDLIKTVEDLGPFIVLMPGFALAHTDPGGKNVYKNDISLITLKNGISFNSPNDPVRVVMAISSVDNDSHVNLLQAIATRMMDDDIIHKILDCSDEKEIVKLFRL